jgi:hypothetical protein
MSFPSENASASIETPGLTLELSASFFQSKFVFALCLLLLIVFALIFKSGSQKLPHGVKPLPRLPGQ